MGRNTATKRTKLEKVVDVSRVVLVISAHRSYIRARWHVRSCMLGLVDYPRRYGMAGRRRLRSSDLSNTDGCWRVGDRNGFPSRKREVSLPVDGLSAIAWQLRLFRS